MGRCLEGCESKALETKDEPREVELSPPPSFDAPIFSEAQRREAAESIARRIEAEKNGDSKPSWGDDASSKRSEDIDNANEAGGVARKRRPTGEDRSMLHAPHLPGARDAVVARRKPGRPRLPKADATGHAEAPLAEICAIPHEPVNAEALRSPSRHCSSMHLQPRAR